MDQNAPTAALRADAGRRTVVGERHAGPPLGLIVLLSAALFINYVDRGSIAIAAPLLQRQLDLTPSEVGWVLSAFFWAYVPLQPVMGWLADRAGAARVLAAGFALWSVSTLLCGLSRGLALLVALRLGMGAGESVFYPSALNLLASRVEDRHRTRATGAMQLGAVVGPAVGTLAGGLIMARYGWRAMMVGLGLASLVWLIPWRVQLRREPPAAALAGTSQPSFAAILRQRALWGGMLGIFCSNYTFYFIFTWLPLYLVRERGLSLASMTGLTTVFYVADAVSVLATGWVLDAWRRRGASANTSYKTALTLSSLGFGVCLFASSGATSIGAVALLLAMGLMDGLNSPVTCAMTQTFAGPYASGRWMGMQNAVANVAGMVAPVATGYLVQASGHYGTALLIAGSVALLGVVAWLLVIPTVRPIDWGRTAAA